MTLSLRNTLHRRIEPVEPIEAGRVRMYTCGPTVYRYAHVGNLRTFILADLIRRALIAHGLDVLHVKNITDVGHLRDERFDRGEDRMLVAAGLEGRSTDEIARAYEAAFHADEALVNILPAHAYPRATEHIDAMIDLAASLVAGGHAYATPVGSVYFDVAGAPGYGRLSRNSLADLRAGYRGDVEPDKRDPADFALWKAGGEGREAHWPSPWGDGFPGWHLECSAMALRHLGPEFDIHTGGIDNVFPHHEDEIAQSMALTGIVPARHWVHGEFLLSAGSKMAKSSGNFVRITDLIAAGFDPLAFRYLAMTTRYGHRLNLTEASLAAAAAGLATLRARLHGLGEPPLDGPWQAPAVLRAGAAGDRPAGVSTGLAGQRARTVPAGPEPEPHSRLTNRAHEPAAPLSAGGRALHDRFVAAIDDDLDTPTALAVVREVLRAPISDDERRWLVLDADLVLGLDLDRVWATARGFGHDSLPAEIVALIERRAAARAAGDYDRADELRNMVLERGFELIDEPGGRTSGRPVSPV